MSKQICFFVLCTLFLLLVSRHEAFAHRVSVFAYVDGSTLQLEGKFSNGSYARNALITIFDLETNTELARISTNDAGKASAPVPKEAIKHGLLLKINAGEGHQNTWRMDKEEFQTIPEAQVSLEKTPSFISQPQESAASLSTPKSTESSSAPMNEEALRQMFREELSKALTPIRKTLALEKEQGPTINEILGGIGWLIGLSGLGFALFSRKK